MPFLSRPGFRLHYQVIEGALPSDTLFLHGNLAANAWWEPAQAEWAKLKKPDWKGRMILAEWRGCGESRDFDGGFDLSTMAEDMVELLRHLKSDKANLVGHSTGGVIGLYAMKQAPALFHRSVLADSVTPKGVEFPEEALQAFVQMSQDRALCGSVILGTILREDLSQEYKDRIVDAAFRVNKEVWLGVPRILKRPEPFLDLTEILVPTLVMHGQLDAVLPVQGARDMAGALPRGTLLLLPKNGHSPNVEDPEKFVRETHDFLFGA
jgi:pimeloyl-ACP methyl ester carboxylesterase